MSERTEGDLSLALGNRLRSRRLRLAVAESCTGGLVGRRITDVPGASDYFRGGILAYADDVKVTELGVDEGVLARQGAVSQAVAEAMALGAASRFGAEAGLAVTGVAGPGGGSEEKPVGTVWIAAAVSGRVRSRQERFSGDRSQVREKSAEAALELLYRFLGDEG